MHPGPVAQALGRAVLTEIVLCPPMAKTWASMSEYKQWNLFMDIQMVIASLVGDLHDDPKPDLKVVEPTPINFVQNMHDDEPEGSA